MEAVVRRWANQFGQSVERGGSHTGRGGAQGYVMVVEVDLTRSERMTAVIDQTDRVRGDVDRVLLSLDACSRRSHPSTI